jgi:hypothetical protein
VGTFTKHINIIGLLKHVKNRRQKAQKSENRLKTLNNVKNSNLKALGLERHARAIELKVMDYHNRYPTSFATYPDMVNWLLEQKAKKEQKRKNENNSIENEKSELTSNERAIFNAITSGNPNINRTIDPKWYSNYRNGYQGSHARQSEPLRGTNLINYRITVAKKLAKDRRGLNPIHNGTPPRRN